MVGTLTLARISTWSLEYLAYLGWLDNPIIDILYGMTSAGVWIARTDTSGRITESNSPAVTQKLSGLLYGQYPTVGLRDVTGPTTASRRVANIPVALDAAGQALNTVLIADPAGAYYGVIDSILIIPLVGCSIAGGVTFAFESPAGTAIFTLQSTALVENVLNRVFEDLLVYNTTDNEALCVDLTGAGGAADVGKTFILQVTYHLET